MSLFDSDMDLTPAPSKRQPSPDLTCARSVDQDAPASWSRWNIQ